MDSEIFHRAINGISPFHQDNLHLDNINRLIPLKEVANTIRVLLNMLKEEQLLDKIYRCKDWFQHDCCLMEKHLIILEEIFTLVKDEENLYKNGAGDDLVNIGLYDGDARWYLRMYVVEGYKLDNGADRLGAFDFSGSDKVIEKLKAYVEENLEFKMVVTTAKNYFESIKAKITEAEKAQIEKLIIEDIKDKE